MFKKFRLVIIGILIYLVFFIIDKTLFNETIKLFWGFLKEFIQVFPIILVLTFLIEAFVPRKWIEKMLGKKSGIKGSIFSLLLGSFSVGPIYGAFPVAKSLFDKGASIGNITVILSAWAVIKVPMLTVEAKFLGSQFMIIRWGLTVIAILIMGAILQRYASISDEKEVNVANNLYDSINQERCRQCRKCIDSYPAFFKESNGIVSYYRKDTPKEYKKVCPFGALE